MTKDSSSGCSTASDEPRASQTQPETLPCPFCGEQPLWGKDGGGYHGAERKFLHCVNSKCPGYVPETVEAWNTRSPDKPEAEAVAWIVVDECIRFVTELPVVVKAHGEAQIIPLYSAPPLPSDKLRGLVRLLEQDEGPNTIFSEKWLEETATRAHAAFPEIRALLSQGNPSSGEEK